MSGGWVACFGDVSLSTEAVIIITGLVSTLGGAIYVIFNLLMKAHDARIADQQTQSELRLKEQATQYDKRLEEVDSQRKSYKEIAEEAVAAVEKTAREVFQTAGKRPVLSLAPVVPEHSSPVTPEQQETAELQTMRARVTAATLALGLPAREPGEPALDKEAEVVRKATEVAVIAAEVAGKAAEVVEKLTSVEGAGAVPPAPSSVVPLPEGDMADEAEAVAAKPKPKKGHDITTKATVTGIDGTGEYEETHTWKGVDDLFLQKLTERLQRADEFLKKVAARRHKGKGDPEDDDDITVTLEFTADGKSVEPLVYEGLCYHDWMEGLHEYAAVAADVLSWGDVLKGEKAKKKKPKK